LLAAPEIRRQEQAAPPSVRHPSGDVFLQPCTGRGGGFATGAMDAAALAAQNPA